MKSSRLLTAYFSPTGTTQKIAHTVAEGIAYPNQDIDLSIPQKMEEISEDTVLLAVVPVYGGRVPAVALKRMSQMRGNGQNAVAVAVYGNREFEDALLELKTHRPHLIQAFPALGWAGIPPNSRYGILPGTWTADGRSSLDSFSATCAPNSRAVPRSSSSGRPAGRCPPPCCWPRKRC